MLRLWILSLSLFLVALYLDSCVLPSKPPLVNDDHSEYFDPLKVVLPGSEEEIVHAVMTAASRKQQVRVVGSGHSRNALAQSDHVILSLEHYKGAVSMDKQAQQVTFRAGTTLMEITDYLDRNGLALGVLPAILEQTIAGAISTGTHGARTNYGNLATLVTKLRLVTGEGNILTLTANDNDTEIFNAAVVSLGLLGVITEVTLQCEPAFRLEESLEKRSLNYCLQHLDEISHSAEHVKAWVEVYSGSCDIYRFKRTEKLDQMNSRAIAWRSIKIHLWEPFLWIASWLPSLSPAVIGGSVIHGGVFYPEYTQVGNSFEILTYPLYVPRNKQVEFAVDRQHCGLALQTIERIVMQLKPASIFIEVRFVSLDDIWLSMNYHRESCQLTVLNYNPSGSKFFDSLWQALTDLKVLARPHFGKYITLTPDQMQALYPKYSQFKRLRAELDPQGTFLNKMLAELFG